MSFFVWDFGRIRYGFEIRMSVDGWWIMWFVGDGEVDRVYLVMFMDFLVFLDMFLEIFMGNFEDVDDLDDGEDDYDCEYVDVDGVEYSEDVIESEV